jgi:response regulator RpfG family c-di-GMP phosphodiesterase
MDSAREQARLSILFVDDEENVLRSLRRLFIDEDYEIYTALSGAEGLEVLKEKKIAVLVSDQRMPKMSGPEFLEQASRLSPESVRIVLTGYADITEAIAAINKGGTYRYITKPWNGDEMISTVRGAAERYGLVQENRYLTELTRRQNEELKKWSSELELDVQEQTIELTYKNRDLLDLNDKLRTNFNGFVVIMSNLIELRDGTVANHSNNVAVLSRKMATRMELGDADVETIGIAAQLHDIGKIGVSDAVLMKDIETLLPFELREYQTHSIRGQAAIDANSSLREAGELIRHHHELMSGSGFPDRLKGDRIPLGSRIIAIADKYDRLLATHEANEALKRTMALTGAELDPGLCHLLMQIVGESAGSEKRIGGAVESEVHPEQLLTGMILSRDVRSGTGILLLPRGSRLTPQKIDSIVRYYRLDPPRAGVYIRAEER